MAVDLDKLTVNHDPEVFFYIQQYLMPFASERLLQPLLPILPGLKSIADQMRHPTIGFRPRSFTCLAEWLSLAGAEASLAPGADPATIPLPKCMCVDDERGLMPCPLSEEYRRGALEAKIQGI